jgi:hypothetical protein
MTAKKRPGGRPGAIAPATARLLEDAKSAIYELMYGINDDGAGIGMVVDRDDTVRSAQSVYERIERALTGTYAPAETVRIAAPRLVVPSPGVPAVPSPELAAMLERTAELLGADAARLAAETRRIQTAKSIFGADPGLMHTADVESSIRRSGTGLARLLAGVSAALYALLHGTVDDGGHSEFEGRALEPGAISALGHEAHVRVARVLDAPAVEAVRLLLPTGARDDAGPAGMEP